MKNILIILAAISILPSSALACCGCEKDKDTKKATTEAKCNKGKCDTEKCAQKLEEIFNKKDADKDGKITFDEFQVLIQEMKSQKKQTKCCGAEECKKSKCTKCTKVEKES